MFEETVASVFRSLGYDATVTAYSGDGGIDVILHKGEERIGVQVKRYRNSISVEQSVRS
jgi:restriction system protein